MTKVRCATAWKCKWIGCTGTDGRGGFAYAPVRLQRWRQQQGHPLCDLSFVRRMQMRIATRVLPWFSMFNDKGEMR